MRESEGTWDWPEERHRGDLTRQEKINCAAVKV